jgi:uncharacterized tellurite resistance protein B-like protein
VQRHPLPTNPNCVSFATGAAELFEGRTWAELQAFAADVALGLHRLSGLAVLGGYAWRVALDRRNERQTQGQLYFVFDGPATNEHLDALEAQVHLSEGGFGPAMVERAPVIGAAAAYAFHGQRHSVWSTDPVDGEEDAGAAVEPWCRQLTWLGEGRFRARVVRRSELGRGDEASGLVPVLVEPAPYTAAEQEAERMRLAFTQRLVEEILEAGGPMSPERADFLENLFPRDLLARLGLTRREVADEYYVAARDVLPSTLGYHDKLALIGVFFSAACCDGAVGTREMRVLREGGELLGLTRDQVVKYLRRFW